MSFFSNMKSGTSSSDDNKKGDVESLSEGTSQLSISESAPGSSWNENDETLVSIMKKLRNNLSAKLKSHTTDDGKLINEIPFKGAITKVINPLDYAGLLHEEYLRKTPKITKVLFVGMNPSTESLTGIPFYDEKTMKELIGEDQLVKIFEKLSIENMRKKTSGSGERFWKFMREEFSHNMALFFEQCFVINYCPLIFVNQRNGNVGLSDSDFNRSNDELLKGLMTDCDIALEQTIQAITPNLIVGIGIYAFNRVEAATKKAGGLKKIEILRITHPSPIANPKYDVWSEKVKSELGQSDIWMDDVIKKRDRNG